MSSTATPAPAATPGPAAERFAVQSELLRLSAQPSGPVLAAQFGLDCGVAAVFAWQYSVWHAVAWVTLLVASFVWRGFFPQRLPDPLTPDNLPGTLRQHTLRIAVHEAAHGSAGILLFDPTQPLVQVLLGVVIMGMALSSAFSISYHARAMQIAVVLLLGPIVVMSLLFGTPAMVAVGALGIGLVAMMWKLVSERSRQLEDAIGLRYNESTLRAQALAGLQAAQQIQAERLRFFSAANHDLRQPVMAIGLHAEVLRQQLQDGAPAQAVQNTVSALARAQQTLEGLTNQLLEIGRIEAATDAFAPTVIALAPLLTDLVREVGCDRVQVRCPPSALAWSDSVALRRIVGNLLDNAVKFTPRGRVLVACRQRYGDGPLGWRIEVRDSGIGIAPSAQTRVFGDFEQAGNVERNLQRGHGLGLGVVRRLAQRLGVPVTLRSAPGRGTVFAVTVPAARSGVQSEAAAHAPETQGTAPLAPGLAVLVVEDNTVVADSLAALLLQWQAQPRVYASAAEALALADLGSIDVALCDIRLPGELDGIALAERLQQQHPDIAIALVSAEIDDATRELACARGWYALHKPVQATDLHAMLASVPR